MAMVALHAIALLFDPTIHFGLAAVLLPLAAAWHPAAVAAGVVAGWLALTLAVSFRMRKWIGQRGWRRLHYASFVAFILAVGHALVVGTDLHGVGGPILAAVVLGPTLWLVLLRVLTPSPKAQLRPVAAASTPSGS
jgi:predicted ferric reductase